MILRTETHIINKNHRLYDYCEEMCFKSKNLYNYTNYIVRKEFIEKNTVPSAFDLNKLLKHEEVFKVLPSKTSQQIIIQLGKNWKSFFKSIKDWSNNKSKYTGRPKLPKYKEKNGRNIVFFDYQQGTLKDGKYKFSKSDQFIETNVKKDQFRQLKIVPYGNVYKICIVYRKKVESNINLKNENFLAIDLGIDNFTTLTNNIGIEPIVINGKVIKSMNQYYNKKLSKLKSYVGNGTSNKIKKLTHKRNNKINHQMHLMSRWIINYCIAYNIRNVVIGRNKDWQRKSNMGKKNNQKFVQIPFEKFINQLHYKGEEVGMNVIIIDERYTSKSSFLDNDLLPDKFGKHEFKGKRISRSFYQCENGRIINADVNGSLNILRKCNPQFNYERVEGMSLNPIRFNIV